ncbi:MarR family transcriptional regulator [Janthinobacterium sp. GW458P]|uniref:MarR family transcriptional regulator n=1 Tax=Janthinobacterium sp. GW458P TaxID=1981504 RepID=UPI000A32263A|nr:MarR family transcriptional regulator [Janthinobacterium sp. GW458P]MBE3024721.1 MarR family transcriptional regulator [Janthinobacterium sp. GW458P]PHV17972.1 MarR family transcriptional regulator [Janthinobacterium sp. BJB303]
MTKETLHPAAIDDAVFLGRAVERLSVLIAEQSKTVFDTMGIVIPVRSCSLMTVLATLGSACASDLARELGHSHQLVMQKIPKLLRLGLIRYRDDDHDARRRLFMPTDEGLSQLAKFEQCTVLIRAAYDGLFAEVGDVRQFVDRAADALNARPLDKRISSPAVS